jgi:hypothetical protein
VASDLRISERRWFTRIWGRGEPLGSTRYAVLLIGTLLLALAALGQILQGTKWWLGGLNLLLVIIFGPQVLREHQRRARERAEPMVP